LGDPIGAAGVVGDVAKKSDAPLLLGSVKSNLATTRRPAGAAGVIKVVLALQHGVAPRTLASGQAVIRM